MKDIFIAILVIALAGGCNSNTTHETNVANADVHDIVDSVRSEPITAKQDIKPIKYEILREPNGGSGVFDFMYIVYVPEKINHDQTQWIFEDIIKQKGQGKIAIDIWSSKKAFDEELKIYQKEDRIFEAGGDLKKFVKERDVVTSKYDKYNIAQYSNNGVDVSASYPEDKNRNP
jgi:hypothetical protein